MRVTLLLILTLVLASCDVLEPVENNNQNGPAGKISLSIKGAHALAIGEEKADTANSANLYAISEDGQIVQAIDKGNVLLVRTAPQGTYLEIGTIQGKLRLIADATSGLTTPVALDSEPYEFMGFNLAGDVVFSNLSVFRRETKTIENLSTTFEDANIQSLSGNFAIIKGYTLGDETYQVLDTVTSKRYNVQGCNGPRVAALSTTAAVLDDCSALAYIDMVSGSRSAITDISDSWNHESLIVSDGAILLSQTCPSATGGAGFRLCHVSPEGRVTAILTSEITPGVSACMNCGGSNETLFSSDKYVVIRELAGVSAVLIGVDQKMELLTDLNVTKVSTRGALVYYLAEDNVGSPIAGFYNLDTSENTSLDFDQAIIDMQAIPE